MLKLGLTDITFRDVIKVSRENCPVTLSPQARKLIEKSREAVLQIIANKQIAYGITTGFGAFKNTVIEQEEVKKLQENLILSHAVGVGEPFPEDIVRGIMFLVANYLSKGHSGVRPVLVETVIEMLNKEVHPIIPQKGSVGSSGDLAPSAHMALVLLGKGEAMYKGKRMKGDKAMKLAGIPIIRLEAKEGLAITNNTTAQTSLACHALSEANKLLGLADICGALSTEALRGTEKAFDARIHELKPHTGQKFVTERLRKLLKGSTMVDNDKTQDQYSLRCMPQIHGAVRDAVAYAEGVITTEINSVTDNPLIFPNETGGADVISGGNFHGEPIAIALDTLGHAISEIANISDRRIAALLDPATNNGLPAFLAEHGGVNSGMMILQYTTASLASENKILSHPASVDSIPTSANIEDLVSMGTIAARKAFEITQNVKNVLAIELLVASQAIDFRLKQKLTLGKMTQKIYNAVREIAPYFEKDTIYYPYIKKVVYNIDQDIFQSIV